MVSVLNPRGRAIQSYIMQLNENENLTSSLTDSSAKILLRWAEDHLSAYNDENISGALLEEIANKMQRLVRNINLLIKNIPDLEEQDLVKKLIQLVELGQEIEMGNMRNNG